MPELVIVETERGAEVWPNEGGSSLVATFANRADADLFLAYASKSDDDRIRNAAVNIARAFPVLNLSDAPVNPEGELVLRIAQIISADFPMRHSDSRHLTATVVNEGDEDYAYAVRLATVLRDNFYADNHEWEPLNTLNGVLSQIDNMIVGVVRRSKSARTFRIEEPRGPF